MNKKLGRPKIYNMPLTIVGLRIPDELNSKLKDYSYKTGIPKNRLIIMAIEKLLGVKK